MPHTNNKLLDEVLEDRLETPDVKCRKRDSKEIGCNGNRTEISSDNVEEYRIELSEDMKVSVDTSSNNQIEEGIEALKFRWLDTEEMPDKDIIWNTEDCKLTIHTDDESESEEETYWDSSSQVEEVNEIVVNYDSDSEGEIYWEVVEAVTNCESESEEEIYWESLSQTEEVDETVVNYDSDPKKEIYWEVVEAVTNYESESEEEIYWESLSQVEEVNETVINHESDPEEEIYCEVVEAVTNCESESEEEIYWERLS